jgi:probable HAF family extracellular repeat protein
MGERHSWAVSSAWFSFRKEKVMHAQHHSCRSPRPRSLHLEVLEDRCLLSYTLTDLTTILGVSGSPNGNNPNAINNLGQIALTVRADDGLLHAVVWEPGAGIIRDLGEGGAVAINDAGQVAGTARIDGVPQKVLWDSDGTIIAEISNAIFIRPMNNVGQVAGFIDIGQGYSHAALWDPAAGVQDLGSLGGRGEADEAEAINDAGVVVGGSYNAAGYEHAFVWDGSNGMQDLTPGATESFAGGINNAGQIVGNADGNAFLAEGGTLTTLGRWIPHAINNAGQIVGYLVVDTLYGALYADGALHNLNGLIPPGTGLTVHWAFAINDAGWIMANALDARGHFHEVLLTPDGGGAPQGADPGVFGLLTPVHEATPIAEIMSQPPANALPKVAPLEAVASLPGSAVTRQATDAVFASSYRRQREASPLLDGGEWILDQSLGAGLILSI